LELALGDSGSLKFLPSVLAASAVYLARKIIFPEETAWNPTIIHYTEYSENELMPCVKHLNSLLKNRGMGPTKDLKAITRKYWNTKMHSVAKLIPLDNI